MVIQIALVALFWFLFVSPDQLRNAKNILMINDPTENIGSFWYLMLEMFPDKLEFMKLLYLLETGVMFTFCIFHVAKTFDMLDLAYKSDT